VYYSTNELLFGIVLGPICDKVSIFSPQIHLFAVFLPNNQKGFHFVIYFPPSEAIDGS
jgi:hypothetical protein